MFISLVFIVSIKKYQNECFFPWKKIAKKVFKDFFENLFSIKTKEI